MAVPNVLGVISNLMLENVPRAVTNLHVAGDAILDFIDSVPAEQKLGAPNSDGSSPFTAEHTLQFNEGGSVTQLQINKTSRTDAGSGGYNVGIDDNAEGPNPLEAPQPTIKRVVITLKETAGVITVAKDQVFAEDFGLMVGPFVARMIAGVVKKLRNWRAANAYTDGTGWLCQVGAVVGSTDFGAADIAVTLKNGTFRRFEIGERYDFALDTNWPINDPDSIGDTSAALINGVDVFCVGINPSTGIVKFRAASTDTFALAVDDHIMKKGAATLAATHDSHASTGFDGLINNTGTLYGLNRSNYEILQSQIDSSGSSTSLKTPQPEMITDPIDNIVDAGYEPPAFVVSSRSVRSKYAYVQGGQGTFMLPGYVKTADGGIGSVQTSYEDRVYNWMLSSFCENHTIYGIEPRSFVKYAPGGHMVVNWWMAQGGINGVDNIFRLITNGPSATKTFAAEWSSHFELAILQPFLNFVNRNVKGQKD